MASNTNSVAYLTAAGAPLSIKETSIPVPAADEVVIENKAISLNPIDSIIAQSGFLVREFPIILGMDSAGVIVSVGADAADSFAIGDRVFALTESLFSPNQDKGGFQKYSAVRTLTTGKIPQNVSFVEASTFPLALLTAGDALFKKEHLALDFPEVLKKQENGKTILIWGGASSVGANAIQLAIAAGYRVVSTSSEQNAELVRDLGAAEVFDYRKLTVVEDIVASLSGENFAGTFLAAASGKSFEQAAEITKAIKGVQHVVSAPLYPKDFKADVELTWTNLSIADYPEEGRQIAKHLFGKFLPQALESESYKVIPAPKVLGSGIEKLQDALDTMSAGVSATKLVVEL